MKKIFALTVVIAGFLQGNALLAADDVYDAPVQKKVKVKQTYSEPSQPVPAESEKTVPYTEENSSTARGSSFNDNSDYRVTDENLYSDDYSGSSFGYTDRIRRFHNPSIQFNYGWNNWNSNYYDPWNTYNNQYGWNNWNSYSFTPSWTYGYNNFYNPFWNSSAIVIIHIQPGFNNWYNTGFYNPWSSWNNYSWNSWNNYGWNGFSPYCSNAIFNNGFSNYNGYYDYNKKNVVYTPRTGTYGNSSVYTGTRNYNSGGSSNTNSGGWNVSGSTNTNNNSSNATNNNNSGSTKTNKWSNSNSNTNSNNSGGWSNPYKNNNSNTNNNYNTQPSNNNNNWNNSNSNSNSNGNSNGNSSGIKIGSRPK